MAQGTTPARSAGFTGGTKRLRGAGAEARSHGSFRGAAPLRSAARELLLGLLLACAVLCAGTLLAQLARMGGGDRAAQEAMVQTQDTRHKLETGQLVALFTKYSFAFADAAIRFENVPKYDTSVVTAISAALPDGVAVASMVLDGRSVTLLCTAQSTAQAQLFCANLLLHERFDLVLPSAPVPAEGGYTFEVSCSIHMEQGPLALAGEAAMHPQRNKAASGG